MVQTTLKKSIVQPNNGKNRQKTEVFTTYTPEYISLGLWQDWQEMTKDLEKWKKYDQRGLATLRANGPLIILEELLHLLVKDLQLLGCEWTTVFSP